MSKRSIAAISGTSGADPTEVRRFLEIIGRHTLRMERLVRDLLRLARLDAGQEPLEHVPCSVEALFDGVEAELATALDARQPDRRATNRARRRDGHGRSGQAARRAAQPRSRTPPTTRRRRAAIVMGAERSGQRMRLTVADEGPGIPEADLPRIFERFYRVDKSRTRATRDPGGTGLGLAIVKHLIELHGGTVTAANRREGGAIFTIELPDS